MGTRYITAVYCDGEFKVAQYGQWDGYPSGQGRTILAFLQGADLEEFREKVRACTWATPEYLKGIEECPPELSRNTGADVLSMLSATLVNSIEFVADGLFCEWAYVIDLDANTFEVYAGFQTDSCEGRFAEMDDPEKDYRPVSLLQSYSLSTLPSLEEFLELEDDE